MGRETTWLCVHCGYACDAYLCVTDEETKPPADGDLSLCLNCGARYVRDATWRPLSTAEYQALDTDTKRVLLEQEVARQRARLPDLAAKQGYRA